MSTRRNDHAEGEHHHEVPFGDEKVTDQHADGGPRHDADVHDADVLDAEVVDEDGGNHDDGSEDDANHDDGNQDDGTGRRHGGPRNRHHGPRGRGNRGDRPWEALFSAEGPFGSDGPFGPAGPFAKGGFFGPGGADVARSLWEQAAAAGAPWAGDHQRGAPAHPRSRGEDQRPGADERHTPHGREWSGPRGRRGGPGRRGGGRRPRGDVRLAALRLIAEEPRNGYQVIEELSARTAGAWKPSSGAVYPALSQLEDEGLIEAFDNDGRKGYRLTDTGRDAVNSMVDRAAPWETATQDASEAMGGRPGGQLWQAFGQVAMAAKAVASSRDEATITEAAQVLDQTRRSLYRILADGPQDTATAPAAGEGPGADDTDAT